MAYTISGQTAMQSLNESDRTRSILQNISNILRTRQGTVPMFREFGLPMNFMDKPMPAALPTLIIEVREAIEQYEPRAELLSVNFVSNDKGELFPEVEVNILNEQESGI